MIRIRELKLPLEYDDEMLLAAAAKRLRVKSGDIRSLAIRKKAVDARKKSDIRFAFTVDVSLSGEAGVLRALKGEATVTAVSVSDYTAPEPRGFACRPVVVGSGPAGLFAALWLAQAGAKPLLLERGQDVDARAAAVQRFWQKGELDEECNVQFGEGGAGTFSDGKLTTGTHDARISAVLDTLHRCGAPDEILTAAKPHIGTDRLRLAVKNLRGEIIRAGGEVLFGARFCDYETKNGRIAAAIYEKNGLRERFETDCIVLAVGHSARDVFELLNARGAALEAKSFAVGMRIEHRQSELDHAMYGAFAGHPALGAADYKLSCHLPDGRGVYTFCMCPGGQVVASASERGGVVTNGMSLFARDGENANSALLASVSPADFGTAPLAGVEFQRKLERAAFAAAGGDYSAPMSTVGAFLRGGDVSLGGVSPTYRPSVRPVSPENYLPTFITDAIRAGLGQFGRKIQGFDTPEAVLTGVESRSSSPVRILRGADCAALGLEGLYPCGEGAGYAGGIVSAAVDGIRCAEAVINHTKMCKFYAENHFSRA